MNRQDNNKFAPDEDLLSMIKRWEADSFTAQTGPSQPFAVQQTEPSHNQPSEPSYLTPDELQGFQAAFTRAQAPAAQQPVAPQPPPVYLQNVLEAADRAWAEPLAPADTPPSQPAKPGAKQVRQMKKKQSKKRKRPVRRFLSWVLALAMLLTGGLYLSAYAFAGKVGQTEPLPSGGASRMGITNILVIGMDGEGVRSGGEGRSDTILLLSIDRLHGKLKLTSFLRDSWLPMPDGSYNRINTAFFYGGAPRLTQVISENFDIRIDHCVQLSFTAFEVLVDALGGIEVPVTEAEAKFLCNTTRLGKQIGLNSMREQMGSNGKGAVKMTGEQALIYSRIRKLDSDFNRTERQRKVFGIMAKKALRSPVSLLFNIGDVLPYIQTDMSRATLAAFATAAPLYLTYEMQEHYVPSDGSWQSANRGGASVITMDIARNTQELHEFIFG